MDDDFYGLSNGLIDTWLPVRGSSFDSDAENWSRTELRGELLALKLKDGTALPEHYLASEDGFFMCVHDASKHVELDEVESFRLGSPALSLADSGFSMFDSPMDEIRTHMADPGRLTMFFNAWRPYHPRKLAIKVLHDVTLENGDVLYGMYHNGSNWHQMLSANQIRTAFGVEQEHAPLLESQVFQVRYSSYYLKYGHEEFLV